MVRGGDLQNLDNPAVQLQGPFLKHWLTPPPAHRNVVMIAAGTGVNPSECVSSEKTELGACTSIVIRVHRFDCPTGTNHDIAANLDGAGSVSATALQHRLECQLRLFSRQTLADMASVLTSAPSVPAPTALFVSLWLSSRAYWPTRACILTRQKVLQIIRDHLTPGR